MATDADHYLTHCGKYPRFSRAEESKLTKQAHAGCVESRNQLVLSQVPWILTQINRRWHYDKDNALGEALLRLIMSIDTFDPTRGRLTTYANYAVLAATDADRSYRRAFPAGTVSLGPDDADAIEQLVDSVIDFDYSTTVQMILGRVGNKLGSRARQICELRLCENLHYEEIGARLGVSKQAVGAAWLKIRKFLKAVL